MRLVKTPGAAKIYSTYKMISSNIPPLAPTPCPDYPPAYLGTMEIDVTYIGYENGCMEFENALHQKIKLRCREVKGLEAGSKFRMKLTGEQDGKVTCELYTPDEEKKP